jgi:trehalose 6-phosphate phosphatase
LVAESAGQLCLQGGKRVIEVRPTGADKGAAIDRFMDEAPFKGRRPVFIGDDASDELGFAAINRSGGISIRVGPGASVARYRLSDVAAVRTWLAKLCGG